MALTEHEASLLWEATRPMETVLVVQPHFDDAVFSMGGRLAFLSDQDCDVHVVTLFGGVHQDESKATDYVKEHIFSCYETMNKAHKARGVQEIDISEIEPTSEDLIRTRLLEEELASRMLRYTPVTCEVPEALFRFQGARRIEDLHCPPPMYDYVLTYPALFQHVWRRLVHYQPTVFYFPGGFSTHIDHQLCSRICADVVRLGRGQGAHFQAIAYKDYSLDPNRSAYHLTGLGYEEYEIHAPDVVEQAIVCYESQWPNVIGPTLGHIRQFVEHYREFFLVV